MKIAVLGAGGIGGFIGGALAKAGEDVTLIARGSHLQTIREGGLRVESVSLGNFECTVKATNNPSEVGPVDLVLFCVKAYDTDSALETIGPLIGENTIVLSFQNGVDNEEKIAEKLGKARVLGGAIGVESFIAHPGLIQQTWGPVMFAMGEMDGSITPTTKKIHASFTNAGLKCELSNCIREVLWEKFTFICPIAGVCCVARASIGEVMAFEAARNLYLTAIREVDAVTRAHGVHLVDDIVERTFAQAVRAYKRTKPSMLRDLERGKRLEIDALSGTVCRLGDELSVSTPVHGFIYASLKPQDDRVDRSK